MNVLMVVHQFLRHVGKHLTGGRRPAAGPLHAALLARGGQEILPRQGFASKDAVDRRTAKLSTSSTSTTVLDEKDKWEKVWSDLFLKK